MEKTLISVSVAEGISTMLLMKVHNIEIDICVYVQSTADKPHCAHTFSSLAPSCSPSQMARYTILIG